MTHFQHVNNPNLVTFLFSAGRKDGGKNTFLTIDTQKENPFEGEQEQYVDGNDEPKPWNWVSAHTLVDYDTSSVKHYALFAGGSSDEDGDGNFETFPSALYVFKEKGDGTLEPAQLEWREKNSGSGSPRHSYIADLGNIYNSDHEQVSKSGIPDLVISGTFGLELYSSMDAKTWTLSRSLSLPESGDDTAAYMGVEAVDDRHLIVAARSACGIRGPTTVNVTAENVVWDYQKGMVVQKFSGKPQMSVSVAVLDGGRHVLLGSGSSSSISGAPNVLYDVTYTYDHMTGSRYLETSGINAEKRLKKKKLRTRQAGSMSHRSKGSKSDMHSKGSKQHKGSKSSTRSKAGKGGTFQSLEVAHPQLARNTPLDFTKYMYTSASKFPVSSEGYFSVPRPGHTKTRQVKGFRLDGYGVDFVLEVNSGQTCNIYYRENEDEFAEKVMPLPGSEGDWNDDIYARAGDVLEIGDQLYVIISNWLGHNTVYSFSTDVFHN